MIEIKRKPNEPNASVVYRFIKKVKQSGVLKEAKTKRFHSRTSNKRAKRLSAIYRGKETKKIARLRKLGLA